MLTSQFSVKPENPRLFLKQKGITFVVFLSFFFFGLFAFPLDDLQFSNGMVTSMVNGVLYTRWDGWTQFSANQVFQPINYTISGKGLFPWMLEPPHGPETWQRNIHIYAAYPKYVQVPWMFLFDVIRIWCYYHWWPFQICPSHTSTNLMAPQKASLYLLDLKSM